MKEGEIVKIEIQDILQTNFTPIDLLENMLFRFLVQSFSLRPNDLENDCTKH